MCNSIQAQLPQDFVPCAVSNMQCRWVNDGEQNNVVITFTTPTQATKYDSSIQDYVFEDMNCDITSIAIQRISSDFDEITPIGTISAPEKGVELSFTDTNVSYGTYMYRVLVRVGNVTSNMWDWSAIKTVVVGQVPADFTNNDVNVSVSGKQVSIEYTVPALSSIGEALIMPVTCTVSEVVGSEPPTYTTLQTVSPAVPGQTYTFVRENVSNGSHTYAFQASTESGANNGSYRYCVSVYIGQDVPGYVRNAKAKTTDGGVLITWEAPQRGLNGGEIGALEDITYTIRRKTSVFDATGTIVAEGISGYEYTDAFTTDEEASLVYEITAINASGEGPGVNTNSVFIGNASALPFVENFETIDEYGGISFDNKWQKDYTGYYCTWYTSEGPFYVNDANSKVQPHQGKGLAYAMYSSWGTTDKWDAITSGHINFSEADNPELSLWLYDVSTGSDMKLSIQTTTDGNEFTTELEVPIGNAETDGWREIKTQLPSLKNVSTGQIRLRTDACGTKCFAVVIDELCVSNGESVDPGTNPGDNPGTDPGDNPGDNPNPEDEPNSINDPSAYPAGEAYIVPTKTSGFYQLEALGMSDNHRYVCGLNVATFSSFIWDTETGKVTHHDGDHINSDFRCVTDDGQAYGILSPDGSEDMMEMYAATFGTDGVAQILDDEKTQIFDVTPDGTIAVGSTLDDMWMPTACIWRNGERSFLPVPTSAECGIAHDGANAMFVSADGKVIAGYLQDWYSSRPAIIWRMQEDGNYKPEVVAKDYWGNGNTYRRFETLGLSANGEWLALSVQYHETEEKATLERMARMNLITGELTESADPVVDYFDNEEMYYYPTAVANDGTCIGNLIQFDGARQGLIWQGDDYAPRYMTTVIPGIERLEEYDFFINCPVAISPDGQYIAGFGCPITEHEDGLDYDFESYLLNRNGSTFDAIQTVKLPGVTKQGLYDLLGRRLLSAPKKGLYIENGNKHFVK